MKIKIHIRRIEKELFYSHRVFFYIVDQNIVLTEAQKCKFNKAVSEYLSSKMYPLLFWKRISPGDLIGSEIVVEI